MKHCLILLTILFTSSPTLAICTDGRIGVEVHLSGETLGLVSTLDSVKIPFGLRDTIVVFEDYSGGVPNRQETLKYGYVSSDGAGNFEFKAVSFVYDPPIHISIYHDHEISHEEGIEGFYRNRKGQDFNLNSLRCGHYDLVVET